MFFSSLKMIKKKRVHLTIGIITLGIHGNECPSCELLSGIIKEWGDAWASVATTRMPAGGSPTHSLATSRTSRRGFFAGNQNVKFLGIPSTRGWDKGTVYRSGWLVLLDCTLREAVEQGMIDWLLRVYVSAAADWHVAFFHFKNLSNELRVQKQLWLLYCN